MEYTPGEKVVMECYQMIVMITGRSKKYKSRYFVRGWDGVDYYNWVAQENGIRPLTPEETEMDFEEWENEADYAGGIQYCEAALDLALETHDKEWFNEMWTRKKAFETLLARRKEREAK